MARHHCHETGSYYNLCVNVPVFPKSHIFDQTSAQNTKHKTLLHISCYLLVTGGNHSFIYITFSWCTLVFIYFQLLVSIYVLSDHIVDTGSHIDLLSTVRTMHAGMRDGASACSSLFFFNCFVFMIVVVVVV